ncbi:MAG: diguanylate cyclase [Gracilibacteraceae bacterium]|nr:diguanylate cyclase [Gracilibacteraceae bacterium]
MLYNPADAKLDVENLPEDYQMLGKGLLYFVACVQEVRALAKALASGDLSGSLPSPGNEMAAPLKALHASLRHLTWQTQQVARGDYKQRVDFMGEFAVAFNAMIKQLSDNRIALVNEIEKSDRRALELEQSNSLFATITAEISQWIIVVDRDTLGWLFTNHTPESALRRADFRPQLEKWLGFQVRRFNDAEADAEKELAGAGGSPEAEKKPDPSVELELQHRDETQYFSARFYPLKWRESRALACVLFDVSDEKKHLMELEDYAYRDTLTKKYSRHYGMTVLHRMIEERKPFALCFVDLDNLKYVNDEFGHSEGDAYILRIVKILDEFAPDALISRLGGDEFMIIAEGWTMEEAAKKMEELRVKLRDEYNSPEAAYSHSFSFGVVEKSADGSCTASDLLGSADEKMYAYKRAHKIQRGTAAVTSGGRGKKIVTEKSRV